MQLPPKVSEQEWQQAHEEILAKEKRLTKESDALAAERRRRPIHRIEKDYVFEEPDGGEATLLDLFKGRSQLVLYHFMFAPSADEGCDGCSMVIDHMGPEEHLNARDTSFAIVSSAPQEKLQPFRERMGWDFDWYSSGGTEFNRDFGLAPPEPQLDQHQEGEMFGLSIFIRDGDEVYRQYFTQHRGVEPLASIWGLLDRSPLGRQEEWEDSPKGYPQEPPYQWWRHRDSYEHSRAGANR